MKELRWPELSSGRYSGGAEDGAVGGEHCVPAAVSLRRVNFDQTQLFVQSALRDAHKRKCSEGKR
jgi:hypothetical protein